MVPANLIKKKNGASGSLQLRPVYDKCEKYWYNPQQTVMSDLYKTSSGVPRGSILGPLLFLIFINDFPYASAYFSVRLYADDTSLTASGNDLDKLLSEINNHLDDIFDWLCYNKLTLNLSKTKQQSLFSVSTS